MLRRLLPPPRQAGLREMRHNPLARPVEVADGCLRLLSFNIQVGNSLAGYHHYLTRSWQHVLPHGGRMDNLARIGRLLHDFDLVALQEIDAGSLRTHQLNQVEYLANLGHFPWWYQQLNRNFGPLARHGNGVLSRWQPQQLEDHPLPGPPGRGVIFTRFGEGDSALTVAMMHLALGNKARHDQLAYVRERLAGCRNLVLMGDMNTHADDLLQRSPLADLDLHAPHSCATFPSWRPNRCLDHILLSPHLQVEQVPVLELAISDHLPVALHIRLPTGLSL